MHAEFRGLGLGGGGHGADRWKMRELAKQEHFDWKILSRALRAFLPYWPLSIVVIFVILATSIGGVLPASLTQRIIDLGILKGNLKVVMEYTVALVLTAVVTGLLGVVQTWLSNLIAQNVMADYRMDLFRHLQLQSVHFFASRQAGELVSRVTNDVTAIQNVVTNTLVGFVSSALTIASTLVFMFSMNWQLAILSLIVVPAFVIPTQRVGMTRQKLQGEIQQWLAKLTVQLSETLGVSGALLIRILNRQEAEEKQFAETNHVLRDLQVRQSLVGRWLFMWINMFSAIGPAALWGYGGWLVIHHRLQLGAIVAFTTLLGRLYVPFSQLAQIHVNLLSSIALFRRIFSLLDQAPEVVDGPLTIPADAIEGNLTLQAVSYRYPLREKQLSAISVKEDVNDSHEEDSLTQSHQFALQDIAFHVKSGETVALVGPSGAGKTTLLQLIPRFMDPTQGTVYLDEWNIRELKLQSLRAQIGLVPQDPFFFHDTVFHNLKMAKEEATLEEMRRACRAAQILDTIEQLPDGFHTVVGERGYRLSGGERQRLAIARVLLQEPKIVLLDEATSALDSITERKIQEALSVLLAGRTAIVIAHRLSTILNADHIIVMNQGKIVAKGTHQELLQENSLYQNLYRTQFQEQWQAT
ncbi:ABC transporter ATP-binding protein [Alicyclobacillus tolerans]|uniref:ATP-binding cassette subfamily B protein n=1 Tax=Alicyclobacillus tolerans TaxID=90970 RepID=A0ABT9LVP9_9BACL|nr:ABC transporter ATP-binding protein [Alicyclobacillus tengchongensis]MDP9728335.1 ATP-binding cassette subfamily B protein [Alicyclobacillus tengchongensis]